MKESSDTDNKVDECLVELVNLFYKYDIAIAHKECIGGFQLYVGYPKEINKFYIDQFLDAEVKYY